MAIGAYVAYNRSGATEVNAENPWCEQIHPPFRADDPADDLTGGSVLSMQFLPSTTAG